MANWYVRSGAAGTASGADWANAKLTLAAAVSAGAAGDSFYVSEDHSETSASAITLVSPGTLAIPCRVLCVNHAGAVPPVSADLRMSGQISTTGANSIFFSTGGYTFVYGLIVSAGGGGANNASISFQRQTAGTAGLWYLKNCALVLATTVANDNGQFTIGSNDTNYQLTIWDNTTVQFGNAGQRIEAPRVCRWIWKSTPGAIQGAIMPPTMVTALTRDAIIQWSGVDLSAMTSGNIFSSINGRITVENCEINSGATLFSGALTDADQFAVNIRTDGAATNYKQSLTRYGGSHVAETTIVRVAGATDGTTPISWKIVTTANANPTFAFQSLPILIWNDTVGSAINVDILGIWGSGAVPNNNDIWTEVEYLGASGAPLSSLVNCGLADPLASAAGQSSDSSTWGGSTTPFRMRCTFTPQMKGPLTIRVYAGKASTTFYVDPQPAISGVTVSKSEILSPGVYINELSAGGAGGGLLVNPGMAGGML